MVILVCRLCDVMWWLFGLVCWFCSWIVYLFKIVAVVLRSVWLLIMCLVLVGVVVGSAC